MIIYEWLIDELREKYKLEILDFILNMLYYFKSKEDLLCVCRIYVFIELFLFELCM